MFECGFGMSFPFYVVLFAFFVCLGVLVGFLWFGFFGVFLVGVLLGFFFFSFLLVGWLGGFLAF